jgi:aspartyl-tRNA(Asn)/glutamyl-tRNA(Gln) amidotransferase subunit A
MGRLQGALSILNPYVKILKVESVTKPQSSLSIKANLCVANNVTTAGSRSLLNYKAVVTSVAVERALECGTNLIGSTNMDEFGMGSSSTFSVHGPVLNPFSLPWVAKRMVDFGLFSNKTIKSEERKQLSVPKLMTVLAKAAVEEKGELGWLTAGGSSGGAAVSVATNSVNFALASDTGGSIRLPAAFCGCVGFKPSYGRIPRWGLIAYASSLDTIGIISNSVKDVSRLYIATAGYDNRDNTSLHENRNEIFQSYERIVGKKSYVNQSQFLYLDEIQDQSSKDFQDSLQPSQQSVLSTPLLGLRIGLPIEYRVNGLHDDIKQWWEKCANLLREAGAEVIPVSLPHTTKALEAYYTIAAAEAASNLARFDGLRYGYHSSPLESGTSVDYAGVNEDNVKDAAIPSIVRLSYSHRDATSTSSPSAIFSEFYTRNRNESFGAEVKRRIARGNFLLSLQGTEKGEYKAAEDIRRNVRKDFSSAFRTAPKQAHSVVEISPLAFLNEASHYSNDINKDHEKVDVLLTPVSPSHPWLLTSAETLPPAEVYANDVLTVPANLAHLPSISLPVGYASYPTDLVDITLSKILNLEKTQYSKEEQNEFKKCAQQSCKLPISLQLIGRLCDEETLLKVARVLEERVQFKTTDHLGQVNI